MSKSFVVLAFFSLLSCPPVFSQGAPGSPLSPVESANLKQGAEAYRNEDWVSAVFFLRKAVSVPGSASDENMFMLIKSEIYAGEYGQAHDDCERFLDQFPFSPYSEYVRYQNGRLLHLLARNEDAILSLSDFCHEFGESELYPLAVFWIAESFYDEYNFDTARALYEMITVDFPACEKAPQAQYKLDLIERREREEKLLYLLKVIGEENLSTREEYERQLRVYALEDEKEVKKSLIDAQARIAELEALLESGSYSAEAPEVFEAADEPSVENVVSGQKDGEGSGVSKPVNPMIQIIQSVNEPSVRVRQNPGGQGAAAVRASEPKVDEIRALKRKAGQLRYILEEQAEAGVK